MNRKKQRHSSLFLFTMAYGSKLNLYAFHQYCLCLILKVVEDMF